MKLTCFRYGSTFLKESEALRGGRSDVSIPISLLYFLFESGEDKILIDVGCDTMPGFFLKEHISPVELLEKHGISRDDITCLVLTHAHHDHAECAHYYKNATVIIHEDAYPYAKGFLKDNSKVTLFSDRFSPAKGIEIIPICGHAQGSSIAVLRIGGKEIVLCGDECYVEDSFEQTRLSGAVLDSEKAMAFLKEYKDHPNRILFHDNSIIGTIGATVLFEE